MAPGCIDAVKASCLHRNEEDFIKALADMKASGTIHFHKTLVRKCIRRTFSQCHKLALPASFVKEHGGKFRQWVILKTLSSKKPWRVRLGIEIQAKTGSPTVKFAGGWRIFAAENRLKEGDSLIFVPNPDAISEFRVYIFRGVTAIPGSPHNSHTPGRSKLRRSAGDENMTRDDVFIGEKDAEKTQRDDLGDSSSVIKFDSEQASEIVRSRQRKSLAPQYGANSKPCFRRQLVAYTNKYCPGRMEVPARFVNADGMAEQLQDVVELQGVHQESPVRTVACTWTRQDGNRMRLYFTAGWPEFVKENGLKVGQELEFTLTSESFFVVRVVVRVLV